MTNASLTGPPAVESGAADMGAPPGPSGERLEFEVMLAARRAGSLSEQRNRGRVATKDRNSSGS